MGTKIMIVDDSEILRNDLKAALVGEGYDVVEGANGALGLETLEANPDVKLIVCDVNMPEMDGITMCQKVHENDSLPKVPIIMLTTEANPEVKTKAEAFGVKAWITKPFVAAKLLAGIKKLLFL